MIHLLKKWLNGTAKASDERELERAVRNDDFGRDALEGYRSMPEANHAKNVAALKSKLRQQDDKRRGALVWWRVAAAAAMIGVVATWFLVSNSTDNVGIAASETKAVQSIEAAPKKETPALNPSVLQAEPEALEMEEDIAIAEEQSGSADAPQAGLISESKKETIVEVAPPPLNYEGENIAAEVDEEEIAEAPPKAFSAPPVPFDKDANIEIAANSTTYSLDSVPLGETDSQARVVVGNADQLADDEVLEAEPAAPVSRSSSEIAKKKRSYAEAPKAFDQAATSEEQSLTVLKGFVYEESSEEPMIGANVYLKETGEGALTDFDGAFDLRSAQPLPWTLVLSYTGFSSQEVTIESTEEVIVLRLDEGDIQLEEVVITGYASPGFIEIDPKPKGGWKKFDRYLLKNLEYPETARSEKLEGTVKVEFYINDKGQPEQFEVIESVCEPCDKEAIRLLEEGPKWRGKKKRATVAVKFNLD